MTKEEAIKYLEKRKEKALMLMENSKADTPINNKVRGILTQKIEALDMAISALKGGWIPVFERLPEERQSVLVWCPQYKNIYCAYLEKEQWWIFGAFIQIVPNEVVAWQPLPESYKKGE